MTLSRKFLFGIVLLVFLFSAISGFSQSSSQENSLVPLILVQGGTFTLLGDVYEPENQLNEIYLDTYAISKYEVTQELFLKVMYYLPPMQENHKGEQIPVTRVSWYQAIEFCNSLSILEQLDPVYIIQDDQSVICNWESTGYRLPTKAEWEFAARGGLQSKGFTYSGSDDPFEVAWFWKNSGEDLLSGDFNYNVVKDNKCKAHPVGMKKGNELGIHDMSGNVAEFCWDYKGDIDFIDTKQENPKGAEEGFFRYAMGGTYCYNGELIDIQPSSGFGINPRSSDYSTGFRIARSINIIPNVQETNDIPKLQFVEEMIANAKSLIYAGNIGEALDLLNKSEEFGGSEYSDWHFSIGLIGYIIQHDPNVVRQSFEISLKIDPLHEEARQYLGRAISRQRYLNGNVDCSNGRSINDPIPVDYVTQEKEYLRLFGVTPITRETDYKNNLDIWKCIKDDGLEVEYYFDFSKMNYIYNPNVE